MTLIKTKFRNSRSFYTQTETQTQRCKRTCVLQFVRRNTQNTASSAPQEPRELFQKHVHTEPWKQATASLAKAAGNGPRRTPQLLK